MTTTEIKNLLELHLKWLNGESGGIHANLSDADLSGANLTRANLSDANLNDADLTRANLSDANLSGANLTRANLSGANLSYANLRGADLSGADLRGANLSGANLTRANLSDANLSDADLTRANLSDANLNDADLSGAKNLLCSIAWLESTFKFNKKGIIVYKAFSNEEHTTTYRKPDSWVIEPDSVIAEVCNMLPTLDCACGINFATLEWVKGNHSNCDIWECLIEYKWLSGICVPYNTDGKARCSRLRLIKKL